jgi:RNA polymerase primary sigma factor
MNEPLSILEKIIESEKSKQLEDLDPEAEVEFLLSAPKIKKDREREVVRLRFGLTGEKAKTLEEIGKSLISPGRGSVKSKNQPSKKSRILVQMKRELKKFIN